MLAVVSAHRFVAPVGLQCKENALGEVNAMSATGTLTSESDRTQNVVAENRSRALPTKDLRGVGRVVSTSL